jgi:hypothetical protein
MRRHLHAALVALVLVGSAEAKKELKPGFNLFSKEQDVQLGREAAAQVERQMPVVRDEELNAYVQRIGQKLTSAPEADKYPYTFKVVNDPSINAFALPGGPTFVNTGLIKAADNEAQLAGVMAHEIAHVALRHGTNQASKANLIQIPAMLAGAVAGGSMMGQLAQLGIGLGANGVLMKFSRSAESQADLLGAQMLAHAGYNPLEMARFFEKLQAQGGSRGPVFLSSHPDPGNRMQAIQDEIRTFPQSNYSLGDSNMLKRMQAKLSSLPAPAKQPQGSVSGGGQAGPIGEGDPRPSGRLREYRSSAFTVSHPDNWESFGDNAGAMVTLAPRSGLVQDGRGSVSVGYGAMLSFFSPQRQGDLRQGTSELIAQLRQGNPALEAVNRQQKTRVDGRDALVTTMYNESPLVEGRETNLLVTVNHPQGLFYMVFIAPQREYARVQGVFEQMLRSVRFSDR